jgi:hypothetical protein
MKASVTRRIYYSSEFTVAQTISSFAEPSFGLEVPKAFVNFYGLHSANLNSLDTTSIYQNFGFGFAAPSVGNTGVSYTTIVTDGVGTSRNGGIAQLGVGTFFAAGDSGAGTLGGSNVCRTTTAFGIPGGMNTTFVGPSAGGTPPPNIRMDQINIFMGGTGVTCNRVDRAGAITANTVVDAVVGFVPDIIIVMGKRYTANTGQGISIGFAMRNPAIGSTAILNQGSCARTETDNQTIMWQSNRVSWDRAFCVAPVQSASGTAQPSIEILRMNTDGFSYTSRDVSTAASQTISFLAIKTNRRFLGTTFSTSTTTGAASVNLGFTPSVIFGAAAGSSSASFGAVSRVASPDSDSWCLFAGIGGTAGSKNKYGRGTITTSTANTTVTGTGTSFFSTISEGDLIFSNAGAFLGNVGAVNSLTSLNFKANSAATVTGSNYYTRSPAQFTMVFGNEHGNTTSNNYIGTFDQMFILYSSTQASQSVFFGATTQPSTFNRSRQVNLNYATAQATARWGWLVAFENDNDGRDGSLD